MTIASGGQRPLMQLTGVNKSFGRQLGTFPPNPCTNSSGSESFIQVLSRQTGTELPRAAHAQRQCNPEKNPAEGVCDGYHPRRG
jgi:hypothetical protein